MKSKIRSLPLLAIAISSGCAPPVAQTACSSGYRVVSRRYDAALRKTWEQRQDCAHPAWPARSIAVDPNSPALLAGNSASLPLAAVTNIQPVLVRAGEAVRLWSEDPSSRIEITGIAEQSARLGERVNIRIERQSGEAGITVQHIAGVVRGPNSVEIAQ